MWLLAAIGGMFFLSVYPIFADKAGRIHGERMNFIIDALTMVAMSAILLAFSWADLNKVTKVSFRYGLGIGFSGIGFFLALYAMRIAPEKVPIITIVIGFSTVITAVIYNFIGTKLSFWEWFCVGGATFFISALCLLQKRV